MENFNNSKCFFMFEFEEECGLHVIKDLVKDSNDSRIYGFILYTDADSYVCKVLKDNDFWTALDKISGSNWPVFAVRPLDKLQFMQQSMRFSKAQGPSVSYMVNTSSKADSNLPIIRDFGLDVDNNLPCFVVFMWDDNDELQQMIINIEGRDIDSVYHSIEEIIKAVTNAEKAVEPQYKRTVNVFRNVISELEGLNFRHKFIRRGKIVNKMAEYLMLFN